MENLYEKNGFSVKKSSFCRQTKISTKKEKDWNELNTNTDNTRKKKKKKKKKKNGFPPARVATKSPERRLRFKRPLGVRTTRLREHG